jgi:hypothetical protein
MGDEPGKRKKTQNRAASGAPGHDSDHGGIFNARQGIVGRHDCGNRGFVRYLPRIAPTREILGSGFRAAPATSPDPELRLEVGQRTGARLDG